MKINQWIVICFIGLKIIFANPDENTEINILHLLVIRISNLNFF